MRRTVAVVLVASLFAGCVTIPGSIGRPVKPWPPEVTAQRLPSISLVIEGSVEGEGVLGPAFVKWREETLRAYRESGYFTEVVAGLQPKDLRGEIEIHSRSGSSRANALFTGLTFFIIPLKFKQELTVRTRLVRADGTEVTFENDGSLSMWTQLLLLPISPFTPAAKDVANRIVYDLTRATLLQAREHLSRD